jgi:hypothetical protein
MVTMMMLAAVLTAQGLSAHRLRASEPKILFLINAGLSTLRHFGSSSRRWITRT